MQVQVISKSNGANNLIKEYSQEIGLNESSVVLVDVKVEDVEKIEHLNNQIEITLKNGEKIVINNFNIEESSLVFRNEQSEMSLFDFETISYNPINDIELLLNEGVKGLFTELWPWVAGAAVIGGLAIAVDGSSGSNSNYGNNNLSEQEIAKALLEQAIENAKDALATLTGEEKSAVEKALAKAEAELVKEGATADDFTKAATDLNEVVSSAKILENQEDIGDKLADAKADLSDAIENAKDSLNELTGEEKSQVEAEIAEAEAVLAKEDASLADYKAAEDALEKVVEDAKASEATEGSADQLADAKADLSNAIENAQDSLNELTGEEKLQVEAAIAEAEAVLAKEDANIADYKAAEDALEKVVAKAEATQSLKDADDLAAEVAAAEAQAYADAKQSLVDSIAAAKEAVKVLTGSEKSLVEEALATAEAELVKEGATAEDFTKAASDLDAVVEVAQILEKQEDAADKLADAKADLSDAIENAKDSLNELTGEEKSQVEAEIAEAEAVLANEDANVDDYKAAEDALEKVVEDAKASEATEGSADQLADAKADLSNAIENAQDSLNELTGEEKLQVEAAIAEAEAVLAKEDANIADYKAAEDALEKVVAKAEAAQSLKDADDLAAEVAAAEAQAYADAKQSLVDSIAAAKEAVKVLTGSEKSAVEKALAKAEAELVKEGATAEDFTKAASDLDAVVSSAQILENQEDAADKLADAKADLSDAIENAKDSLNELTGEEKSQVEAEIAEAEAVLAKEDASLADYKAAEDALEKVVEDAKASEATEGSADQLADAKADLSNAIENAQDSLNELTGEEYLQVKAAIDEAKAVLAKEDANIADYKAAEDALEEVVAKAEAEQSLKDADDLAAEVAEAEAQAYADAKQSLVDSIAAAKEAVKVLTGSEKSLVEEALATAEAELVKEGATAEDFTKAASDLDAVVEVAQILENQEDAADKLADAKADLSDAIENAKDSLNELTGEEKSQVEAEIAEAEAVLANEDANVDDYKAAEDALEEVVEDAKASEATEGSDDQLADAKADLSNAIENAKDSLNELTGEEKSQVEAAIAEAEAALANKDANVADYKAAEDALEEVVAKAEAEQSLKDADDLAAEVAEAEAQAYADAKQSLVDSIAAAKEAVKVLTGSEKSAVEKALAKAEAELVKEGATAEDFTKATSDLDAVVSSAQILENQEDAADKLADAKADLSDAIENAKDSLNELTGEEKSQVEAEIAEAEAVLAKEDASLADYKAAEDALEKVVEDAKASEATEGSADQLADAKADLSNAIENAQDSLNELTGEEYLQVKAAIDEAKAVLAKEDANIADYKAAEDALEEVVAKAEAEQSLKDADDLAAEVAEAEAQAYADAKQSLVDSIAAAKEAVKVLTGSEKSLVEEALATAEAELVKEGATAEDFTKAASDLDAVVEVAQILENQEDAADKLADAKADLSDAIENAKDSLNELTGEEKSQVEAEIAEAEAVLANEDANVDDYKAAEDALEEVVEDAKASEATEGSDDQLADAKADLSNAIENAKDSLNELTGEEKSQVEAAIAEAEAALANKDANVADYKAAEDALEEVVAKAEAEQSLKDADDLAAEVAEAEAQAYADAKQSLVDSIAAAKEAVKVLTGSEKSAVEKALAKAEAELVKEGATAEDFTKATSDLDAVVSSAQILENQEDTADKLADAKADLSDAIENAKDSLNELTGEEKSQVEAAIAEAEAALANKDANIADYKAAEDALEEVVEDAKASEATESSDDQLADAKADLSNAIENAKDSLNELTGEEKSQVEAAIAEAEAALANKDANVADYKAAEDALEEVVAKAEAEQSLKDADDLAAEVAAAEAQAYADAKQSLVDSIAAAKEAVKVLTGSEKSAVEKALAKAEAELVKEGATAEDFTKAASDLDAVVSSAQILENQEDTADKLADAKADLSDAIENAKDSLNELTGEEKSQVEAAIAEAEAALANEDASLADYKAAEDALEEVVAKAEASEATESSDEKTVEAAKDRLKALIIEKTPILDRLDGVELAEAKVLLADGKTLVFESNDLTEITDFITTLTNGFDAIVAQEVLEDTAEADLGELISLASDLYLSVIKPEDQLLLQTAIQEAQDVKSNPYTSEAQFIKEAQELQKVLDTISISSQTKIGDVNTYATLEVNPKTTDFYDKDGNVVSKLTASGVSLVDLGLGGVLDASVVEKYNGISFTVKPNQTLSFTYEAKLNGLASGTKLDIVLLKQELVNGQYVWTSETIGSGSIGSALFIPISSINVNVMDLTEGSYKLIASPSSETSLSLLGGLTSTMADLVVKDYSDYDDLGLKGYSQQGNIFDQANVITTSELSSITLNDSKTYQLYYDKFVVDTQYGVLTVYKDTGDYIFEPSTKDISFIGKKETIKFVYSENGQEKYINLNVGIESPDIETDFDEPKPIKNFEAIDDQAIVNLNLVQSNEVLDESGFKGEVTKKDGTSIELEKISNPKTESFGFKFYSVTNKVTFSFSLTGKGKVFSFYAKENSTVNQDWVLKKDGIEIQRGTLGQNDQLILDGLYEGGYTLELTNTGSSAGLENIAIISTDLFNYETEENQNNQILGNILKNDNFDNVLYKLFINAGDSLVQIKGVYGQDTGQTFEGKYGTLTIWMNGQYQYDLNPDVTAQEFGEVEHFKYQIKAANGDVTTASLDINLSSYQLINNEDSETLSLLKGSTGNDILMGNEYSNTIVGNGGHDTLIYKVLEGAENSGTGGNGHDTWTDFGVKVDNLDGINISELLVGFEEGVSDIKQFISVNYDESKGEAVLSIDRDGTSGGLYQSTKLLTLTNQTKPVTLDELLENNQIIF